MCRELGPCTRLVRRKLVVQVSWKSDKHTSSGLLENRLRANQKEIKTGKQRTAKIYQNEKLEN